MIKRDLTRKDVRTPQVVSATGGLRFRLFRARLLVNVPLCGSGRAVRLGPARNREESGSGVDSDIPIFEGDRLCNELDEITIHDTIGIFDVDGGRQALAGRMVHFQPHPFIPHEFEAVSIGRFCCEESESGSGSESGSESDDDCTVSWDEMRIVPGEKCVTIEKRSISLALIGGCLLASKSDWEFVEKLATCEALRDCCESDSGSDSASDSQPPPCQEWCAEFRDFEVDMQSGLFDVFVTSMTSPGPACDGADLIIRFTMANQTGDAVTSDATDKFYFAYEKQNCPGGSVEVISSDPPFARKVVSTTLDEEVQWDTTIPAGESREFEVRFRVPCCIAPGFVGEVAFTFGHRASFAVDCTDCPEV